MAEEGCIPPLGNSGEEQGGVMAPAQQCTTKPALCGWGRLGTVEPVSTHGGGQAALP